MKKSKVVLALLLALILSLFVFGCSNKNDSNDAGKDITSYNQLENGEYTVLDVRETTISSHGWSHYYVILILQDDDGLSHYYEYCSENSKDSTYITLAKLVQNNRVLYEDGVITWLDDPNYLANMFENITPEEWEELKETIDSWSISETIDMSQLLKAHPELYCDNCNAYNSPWPEEAKYCRNCENKMTEEN